MTEVMPNIDKLVVYLKGQIPNCAVTEAELDDLRSLYPNVTRHDVAKATKQAIKARSMQPVSYMNRQLRIIRPSADVFNRQINKSVVEQSTSWDAVEAQINSKREKERSQYDLTHGQGSFDRKQKSEYDKLHSFFVKIEREADKKQHSTPKSSKPKLSAKDEKWYSNLVKEVLEG